MARFPNASLYGLLLFMFCSCRDKNNDIHYPQLDSVSSPRGIPRDSSTGYFPEPMMNDSLNLNTSKFETFSCFLSTAKEPILYNYYLGHDIYRFSWFRALGKPVVFSLHKENDKVWLRTTVLDQQPKYKDIKCIKVLPPIFLPNGALDTVHMEIERRKTPKDSIIKANRNVEICYGTKNLSLEEWEEFEDILMRSAFWKLAPVDHTMGIDGSNWIVEAHLENRYWFVERYTPKDSSFKKIGEYLMAKSGYDDLH